MCHNVSPSFTQEIHSFGSTICQIKDRGIPQYNLIYDTSVQVVPAQLGVWPWGKRPHPIAIAYALFALFKPTGTLSIQFCSTFLSKDMGGQPLPVIASLICVPFLPASSIGLGLYGAFYYYFSCTALDQVRNQAISFNNLLELSVGLCLLYSRQQIIASLSHD